MSVPPGDSSAVSGVVLTEAEHPFVVAALIKKRPSPSTETQGARGGIYWGQSADAVRGALVAQWLNDGWSVEILEVNPVSPEGLACLVAYHAATADTSERNDLARDDDNIGASS